MTSATRSICDIDHGTILATVEIAAPPERVFRALTTSDEVMRWWGSDETYRTTSWTADVRPGGAWRAGGRGASGAEFAVGGEYVAVEPPHRLVHTWVSDWDGGHVTTVTWRLEPTDAGTRVTLRHDGFAGRADSCRSHGEGWQMVLGWLGRHLAPAPGATTRFFLIRLLPPRPTFPGDMSAEEAKVMEEHVGYWSKQLANGKAIVFGPVADPQGAWGLGVIRAKGEAEVREFEAGDPVIRSGRGFRYEVLPMARAVVAV